MEKPCSTVIVGCLYVKQYFMLNPMLNLSNRIFHNYRNTALIFYSKNFKHQADKK
jgi:hypothetical protein